MSSKYSSVLLDIDADFMLDDDYNFASWSNERSKSKIVVSGKELGLTLKRFIKKDTDIILEIDHHESLYWWDCYCIDNAQCIHIDAHHDMWGRDCCGGIYEGERGYVDCGNYLQQALVDNIVKKVVYVPSGFRSLSYEKADIKENLSFSRHNKRIEVSSWKKFQREIKKYSKADIITICVSPEWFPRQHWKHIQDLAEIMGAKPSAIKKIKTKADKKWNSMEKSSDRSFAFPYENLAEKEMM
jgi:hypothetical protein